MRDGTLAVRRRAVRGRVVAAVREAVRTATAPRNDMLLVLMRQLSISQKTVFVYWQLQLQTQTNTPAGVAPYLAAYAAVARALESVERAKNVKNSALIVGIAGVTVSYHMQATNFSSSTRYRFLS